MENKISNNLQGLLYYQKALDLANDNFLDKALVNIDKAIDIDPKSIYLLTKGKILAQKGLFAEAKKILNLVPSDSEDFEESEIIKQKIARLKKPVNRLLYRFTLKSLNNPAIIILLMLTVLLSVLYITEIRKNKVTENLVEIYHKTESISADIDKLTNLMNSKDLAEIEDLEILKSKMVDSLNKEFTLISNRINKVSKNISALNKNLEIVMTSLDAEKIEQ
ncbi:MAG: hypothetical protein JXB00_12215 [Bacteroidales bacterium]|nr:hypothetical protein [Bacteroidales bacterium]